MTSEVSWIPEDATKITGSAIIALIRGLTESFCRSLWNYRARRDEQEGQEAMTYMTILCFCLCCIYMCVGVTKIWSLLWRNKEGLCWNTDEGGGGVIWLTQVWCPVQPQACDSCSALDWTVRPYHKVVFWHRQAPHPHRCFHYLTKLWKFFACICVINIWPVKPFETLTVFKGYIDTM